MECYLNNLPRELSNYGLCKSLTVRREVIHLKHILTEVFVKRSIPIEEYLDQLEITLYDYMEYLTNRFRRIHRFSRKYINDPNRIVKLDRDRFFPLIELYRGLRNTIILDFDGVITKKGFRQLYSLCLDRCNTIICSANPTVNREWFLQKNLDVPHHIYACKGKLKKMRCLLEIGKHYDNIFYVDDEPFYLEFAWLFGLKTFIYKRRKILYFTMIR